MVIATLANMVARGGPAGPVGPVAPVAPAAPCLTGWPSPTGRSGGTRWTCGARRSVPTNRQREGHRRGCPCPRPRASTGQRVIWRHPAAALHAHPVGARFGRLAGRFRACVDCGQSQGVGARNERARHRTRDERAVFADDNVRRRLVTEGERDDTVQVLARNDDRGSGQQCSANRGCRGLRRRGRRGEKQDAYDREANGMTDTTWSLTDVLTGSRMATGNEHGTSLLGRRDQSPKAAPSRERAPASGPGICSIVAVEKKDELALLQPTPGYMRLVKDGMLHVCGLDRQVNTCLC